MRVIGTAGHVDHGKSTLVAALTGTHPDRLKEEQLREMTIDLGFAWLTLPNGEQVGIVDVPGHRDFIENMLAGVGGIDSVLFVVAADEGVMPQTREHLAILDLLKIPSGIIVLTKCDLVEDEEWQELVAQDVRQVTKGSVLGNAPLFRVSARTRAGLDGLIQQLAILLAQTPLRPDLGRPRLPVDRVFTMPGFGTVVTGTLLDGRFSVGDEITLLPEGLRGRIRGLQSHKQKVETALPGSRTAINLTGIDVPQVRRGNVLVRPSQYTLSQRLDAHFHLLPDASSSLRHNMIVKLFLGAAEVQARLRLLGSDELSPGEEGWIQLEPAHPVVAVRGDRFILRRPSPAETLGGGMIADPQPARRHKRQDPAVLNRLAMLIQGSPAELLLQACLKLGICPVKDALQQAHLADAVSTSALQELLQTNQLLTLEDGDPLANHELLIVPAATWSALSANARSMVSGYHQAFPLRRGIPRQELKSRLKLPPRPFPAAMRRWVQAGCLAESGTYISLPDFQVRFSPVQQAQVEKLLALFARSPYAPPSIKEGIAAVGDDIFQVLLDTQVLTAVSAEVAFRQQDYLALIDMVKEHFSRESTLTVAQWRDRLNTSRRYVLAFLEHLDAEGITVRDGDVRRMKPHKSSANPAG